MYKHLYVEEVGKSPNVAPITELSIANNVYVHDE